MCTVNIVSNRILKRRVVVTMNKMKNETDFVDDAKDKRREEMKPQMLLVADGQAVVTRTLTACSRR